MSDIQEHSHLEMGEHFHAKHAHKYVAVYLFVMILLAVTGGVYAWQHKKAEQISARVAALEVQKASLAKQLESATPQQNSKAVTPDSSWKTYCDTAHGQCFKYPANWSITTTSLLMVQNVPQVMVTMTNAAQSVQVSYSNQFLGGKPGTFYTKSVDGLMSNGAGLALALKVVGGYFTSTTPYAPFYEIVDDPSTFQPGKTTNAIATQFTGKNGQVVHLQANPTGNDFATTAKVNAWFDTPDAQTALAILQSLYYK